MMKELRRPLQDISEKQFSRLIAVEHIGKGNWLCKCACGNVVNVRGGNLRTGKTKSCGCYRKDFMQQQDLLIRPEPGLKVCCRCKAAKPLELFAINGGKSDGHAAYCRQCANLSSKVSRMRNILGIARKKKRAVAVRPNPMFMALGSRCWCCRSPSAQTGTYALCKVCSEGAVE
ncbi:hypothetical protein UFOVP605_30 [uncultured Caudovirales phage]|uniref:Uncharacterized protein n=1 Tax=uncultured Caudovirales phage TaxID=2100421 RepID=A0A6J5N6D6_9CAUD|nr:hypothetical protein UFOVP605_30 [uncultured Caudovirales phage]